jgi:hypothetical protein
VEVEVLERVQFEVKLGVASEGGPMGPFVQRSLKFAHRHLIESVFYSATGDHVYVRFLIHAP